MHLSQRVALVVGRGFKENYLTCLCFLIAMSLGLVFAPATHATEMINTTNASVVVDGHLIFQVEPSQTYTALIVRPCH